MTRYPLFILFIWILSLTSVKGQVTADVSFDGPKIQVLTAEEGNFVASGKLSTGEVIRSTCDHGACAIVVEYKGRTVSAGIGDDISKLIVYEYDFGNDGDKEIMVVNNFMNTSYLFAFSYGRGMLEKIFAFQIFNYRTVVKTNFIEYSGPAGGGKTWVYYQGKFWEMTPMKLPKY